MSHEAKRIAEETVEELEIFAQADGAIYEAEKESHEAARQILNQANVLVEAQNLMDPELNEEPFIPEKDQQLLFDQIEDLIQAENNVDEGLLQAQHERLKQLEELKEEPLSAFIDHFFEEDEQKEQDQDLKNEIVNDMEDL